MNKKGSKERMEETFNKFIEGEDKNSGLKPDERYASFDYCYNYFYSFFLNENINELSNERNIQNSCMQLGFYLASWGMYRGSSFLLEKSVRTYIPLITAISKMNPALWEIDIPNYFVDNNIDLLLECKKEITSSFGKNYKPTDTLITKVMLGVFGNVPAFDTYVKKGLSVNTFNKDSLTKIKSFYSNNQVFFDSKEIYTFDFKTGEKSNNKYTVAKLVDMYGFIKGKEKNDT